MSTEGAPPPPVSVATPPVFDLPWSGETLLRIVRLVAVLAVAAALGLAGYAQYAIGRPLPGWMSPLSRLNRELVTIYGRPQSVLLAFFLFVGAGLLFVLVAPKDREGEGRQGWPILSTAALWRSGWGRLSLRLALVGFVLWAYVVVKLWSGHYEESYPLLFGLALAGVTALFLRWDLSAGLRLRLSFGWWEAVLVAALTATFFALNVRDLGSWPYTYIGDEGAFFNLARELEDGKTVQTKLHLPEPVYSALKKAASDSHSTMSSVATESLLARFQGSQRLP